MSLSLIATPSLSFLPAFRSLESLSLLFLLVVGGEGPGLASVEEGGGLLLGGGGGLATATVVAMEGTLERWGSSRIWIFL